MHKPDKWPNVAMFLGVILATVAAFRWANPLAAIIIFLVGSCTALDF